MGNRKMGIAALYELIRNIVEMFSKTDPSFKSLPEALVPDTPISDLGLDMLTLPEIFEELKNRLDGKDVSIHDIDPVEFNTLTMRQLLQQIHDKINRSIMNPVVLYVDDEEENLFIFKRRFGKELTLKTFTDPEKALEFITNESSVALVITDEVMPRLNGNALCAAAKKIKPFLKFILITGNPHQDQGLMYNSLKHGKFYEFFNKPLDLEKNGPEYLALILSLISPDK